jgi:hypothetical protein
MSDIFSRANRVLVFLGSEDDCSEVFDYFDAVSKAGRNGTLLLSPKDVSKFIACISEIIHQALVATGLGNPRVCACIEGFLNRMWRAVDNKLSHLPLDLLNARKLPVSKVI